MSNLSPDRDLWTPLFNGRNLSGWYVVIGDHRSDDPDRLVQVHDGAVHMYRDAAEGSEQPFGYIATDLEYSNYDLQVEYRWGTKRFVPRADWLRDAGVLYCVVGKDGVWPRCVECQIFEGDVGDTYAVYTRVTAPVDPARIEQPVADISLSFPKSLGAATRVYQPRTSGGVLTTVGDAAIVGRIGRSAMHEREGWNMVEVIVRGSTAVHIVNGHTVNEVTLMEEPVDGAWVPLRKGRIALQLEGAEVFYRNMRIRHHTPQAGWSPPAWPVVLSPYITKE